MQAIKNNVNLLSLTVSFFACTLFGFQSNNVGAAEVVEPASEGRAMMQVVVGEEASESSRTAARDLADYLGRIVGDDFDITEGDGTEGLAVGAFDEFPGLNLGDMFDPDDPFRREEYVLRSHSDGLYLVGATPAASRLAVWDVLYRLGHRQFFPGEKWEVIPSKSDISIELDIFDGPDFHSRRIWSGGSRWDFADPPFEDWRVRNRSQSDATFNLRTGHVYGTIIRDNQEAFDNNPEFYAKVDGERKWIGGNTKLCISNEGLRELVVDYAVNRIKDNPDHESISMDPSDGGNWCECSECGEMGSVSDRVAILANEVAEAINDLGLGDKYVGIYAYASHSPPPEVEVHPKVVVSIATSFIRGGYTAEELARGWRERGATLGIREYYALSIWTSDLPGRARAANLPYLARTIPFFHEYGARFNSANISDSWGPYGPGYYLIAQLLWDVDKAEEIDELFDDFLERAFGPAKEPMGEFYRLIYLFDEEDSRPMVSEHLLGSMYRHLDEALRLAGDDFEVTQRIHDLVLYTRYVELYNQTSDAGGAERQKMGEKLLRHIYAIRRTMMVESRRLNHRRLPDFDIPEGEELEKVRSIDSYESEEIERMVSAGIEANELLDFEPVRFSRELEPAAEALGLPDVSSGSLGTHAPRHRQVFYTWMEEPGEITLRVRGGMISHFRDRGNVRINLHSPLDELVEGVDFDDSVPPDGEEYTVTLETPFDGLHWIEARDGGDSTFVHLDDEHMHYTVPSEQGMPFTYRGRWNLYFYVPKGTEVVGGYAAGTSGSVFDGSGNEVFQFSELDGSDHFSIAVPEGEDGRLWQIRNASGARYLMTVPPYMARCEKSLLLPREVIESDK